MAWKRFLRALVAVVVILALVNLGHVDSSSPTIGVERSVPRLVAATAGSATSGSVQCRPPSLANCYTEAGMLDYINVVQPMIVQFFQSAYRSMPGPRRYVYVPEGGPFPESACQNGNGSHVQDANAYDYCSLDENIYVGQASMWSFYHDDGDAAPAVGLAHEWGHNIQHQVGVPSPRSSGESVNHENQADCVAGAWIGYAIQQGWFTQEDVGSTERLLITIADAEEVSHGNLQDRAASMSLGIRSGLMGCNSFYPGTPIYTS
jgi:putative neutral zinc metallopeptidase